MIKYLTEELSDLAWHLEFMRPYLEKTHTKKGWQSGSSSKSTCLESVRPPLLPKKKELNNLTCVY
jgi:hypothetical protein